MKSWASSGDLVRIRRIEHEELGIELCLQPAAMDVRTLLDKIVQHHHESTVEGIEVFAAGRAPGDAAEDDFRRGRLPDRGRVELAGPEVRGDDLDILVEVTLRLDTSLLEGETREAVSARTMRRGGDFTVHPLDRLSAVGELRRIVAHEEDIALLLRCAEHRDDPDVRATAFLDVAERGRDRRHVTHVSNVLLFSGHRVHDHRPLQADFEGGGRTVGQVVLPETLSVVHDPGPGFGVVRLVADDQIHRLAFLAEVDAGGRALRHHRRCKHGPHCYRCRALLHACSIRHRVSPL
ncbi:MAG: hypothetical protein OXD35_01625 [Thiotrichales bacterium]|nr:hypothetical protein [Thiotrichales bacterium]